MGALIINGRCERTERRRGRDAGQSKTFASALHIRGLRQRWMFSAVLPILLLVLAVALFSVGVQNTITMRCAQALRAARAYRGGDLHGLRRRATANITAFRVVLTETFSEEKGHAIELQFINTNGDACRRLVLRADGGHAARHERR